MQYIFAHNQFLPADAPFLTAEDRSFRFGDGIFETMLLVNGRIYDFESHLGRLQTGLDFFRMKLNVSNLENDCKALAEKNGCKAGYVRVVASRGAGSVGYLPQGAEAFYVIQTLDKPFPAYGDVSLWVSAHKAHLHVPCKTNSAMLYTMAMMEAKEAGCDNALILSADDFVCETGSGNIFWIKNNILFTPEMSLPFVPGTIRKKIIANSPLPVQEGRYRLFDLMGAEEIFTTNVGGLVSRITSIMPLGYKATGDALTRAFRGLIEDDINQY